LRNEDAPNALQTSDFDESRTNLCVRTQQQIYFKSNLQRYYTGSEEYLGVSQAVTNIVEPIKTLGGKSLLELY
jgi:hypothetical protein